MTPELPPPYFGFPIDWGWAPIGELFEVQQGKAISPCARGGPTPRPFLRTANVLWGRLDLSKLDEMSFSDAEAAKLALAPGDLLVCEGGEIGRAAVWRGEVEHCLYQNHVHRLRGTGEAFPDFIAYWLQAAFLHLGLYAGVGNKTTIPNLSAARLKQLQVPIPSRTEQETIADILGRIQSRLTLEEQRVRALRALKAATMAKLFREGLRGERSHHSEIGPIPEGWTLLRLEELLSEALRNGHSAPASPDGTGVPTFTLTAITQGDFSRANVKMTTADRRRVEGLWARSGDVFIERANTREMVGLAALYTGSDDLAIFPDLVIRARVDRERILPEVLVSWLLDERCRAYFRSAARGTASNMPKIDQGVVLETLVPVPPAEDQGTVAAVAVALNQRIEEATVRLSRLTQLFDSLLGSLMTGALRLRNLAHA